jgi:hypothetical protein
MLAVKVHRNLLSAHKGDASLGAAQNLSVLVQRGASVVEPEIRSTPRRIAFIAGPSWNVTPARRRVNAWTISGSEPFEHDHHPDGY